MEESKLIERLRRKSRGALEQAIGLYTPYVSVTVWRVMGPSATREDVEEVVSDVFLTLWAHAGELDAAKSLRPWLGTVARNKALDRLRMPPSPPPIPECAAAPGPGPEEELLSRTQAEALWRAVDGLDEPDHTLFLRHYWYGDKLKDVARDLGLNQATARTRLARERKKLKEILTKGGERI